MRYDTYREANNFSDNSVESPPAARYTRNSVVDSNCSPPYCRFQRCPNQPQPCATSRSWRRLSPADSFMNGNVSNRSGALLCGSWRIEARLSPGLWANPKFGEFTWSQSTACPNSWITTRTSAEM